MRIPCKKPLALRSTLIGGEQTLVCVPLVAATRDKLFEEARAAAKHAPDILEWRADFLAGLVPGEIGVLLAELRPIVGETPLIFTYRSPEEGGHAPDNLSQRREVIFAALTSPHVDIVDFELGSCAQAVRAVRQEARERGKRLLLSWHNFVTTPDESFIARKFGEAAQQGADIAKVAVMPGNHRDVLTLLNATLAARLELPDMPLISMSMGALGVMSRVFGGNFGSDITFAQGLSSSAPGQLPVQDLRAIWRLLP